MESEKSNRGVFSIRTSGILLPVASLPSRYGIGSLGVEAYHFIDFLKKAGQSYWQILPICPTSYGDSPYQSFSAFAANPYFIDLDILEKKQFLTRQEIDSAFFGDDFAAVDYGALYHNRFSLLGLAAEQFDIENEKFIQFQEQNADWLEDYALFMALKEENGMDSFLKWPSPVRLREEKAVCEAETRLKGRVRFWKVVQFLFFEQWDALREYAHQSGVKIIGDIPIYVAEDSADLWAHSELFQVDGNRNPVEVSGCPPDAFTTEGQLWGNPLYNWEYHKKTGFRWWLRRLGYAQRVYDMVRIDHFRGFESYYAIPAGDKTAIAGRWRKAPGSELIAAVREKLPDASIIAEDLGFLTEDVKRLLRKSGFPGMKVLQFAFDSREESDYLPHNYGKNCVAYTGTHDNTTTNDWQFSAPPEDVAFAKKYLNITPMNNFTESFIRAALGSVADTAVIPLQDYLGCGAEARINIPGTVGENWRWRVRKEALTDELADSIYGLTALFGRLAKQRRKSKIVRPVGEISKEH